MLAVDRARQCVYSTSSEAHSTESHVYRVSYATGKKVALVDASTPGYWSAEFSSLQGYYILSYLGPDVPYVEVYSVNNSIPLLTLEDGSATYEMLEKYHLPDVTYTEIGPISGITDTLNVMIEYPPSFNRSRKYPMFSRPMVALCRRF